MYLVLVDVKDRSLFSGEPLLKESTVKRKKGLAFYFKIVLTLFCVH